MQNSGNSFSGIIVGSVWMSKKTSLTKINLVKKEIVPPYNGI